MQNKFEYLLFLTFSYLCKFFGLTLSRFFSVFVAGIFFYLVPIRKKTVIENLTAAFPEKSTGELRRIAFNTYKSFSVTLIEILYLPFMSKEQIMNSINFVNLNLIKEKYELNKGVILLSAHFGNWEYIAISSALKLEIPFSVIIKNQRNPYVSDWLNKMRTRWGNKIVPLGISIRQVYKELLDKKVVAMVADQRGPSEGIRVNFFNKPSSIYSGTAQLALKAKVPVLCGIPIRQKNYSYIAEIVEISSENLPEDNEGKIKELTQRYYDHLESLVREHPEQWLWMHKRWKY
jgi:Kdo2-lipid IVA lauroyltransferase/acyltransferase